MASLKAGCIKFPRIIAKILVLEQRLRIRVCLSSVLGFVRRLVRQLVRSCSSDNNLALFHLGRAKTVLKQKMV